MEHDPSIQLEKQLAPSALYTQEEIEKMMKRYKNYRGITKEQFASAIQQYMRAMYNGNWTLEECNTAIDIVTGTIKCLLAQGETVYLPGLCKFSFKYVKPGFVSNNFAKLKSAEKLKASNPEYYAQLISEDGVKKEGRFSPQITFCKGDNDVRKMVSKNIIPVGFEGTYNASFYKELEKEFGTE